MAFFKKAAGFLSKTTSARISQEIPSSRLSIFQVMRCMSSSKVFVGGLSYNTDDTSLREAFDKYGEVAEARVIVDRETGRSRGFGFVTYSSSEEASAAIQALDQQDLHGRRIRVNYANDRTRGYGGGGGYNSGGFGGGYGGGGAGGYGGSGYGGGGSGGYGGGGSGGYGGGGSGGYGGGGSGGFGGGSNYGSGVGSFGNSAETNSYDGQNFGVAGGAGGSDSYFGGGAANSGYEGGFGTGETNDLGTGGNEQSEANYRDDDETPDNYADRRS